jgi:hypothetical protein
MTNSSAQEDPGWKRPTQTFHAHFDCFSGAAGDMMLAACLDAAGDDEQSQKLLQHVTNCLEQGMPALKGEFGLETKMVWRGGRGSIAGLYVNVTSRYHHQAAPVPQKKASEAGHNHSHGHSHSHRDEDPEPSTDFSVLEADTDPSHEHGHSHSHSSSETTEKVGDSRSHSHDHIQSTEKNPHSHGHDHDHGHSHLHSQIKSEDTKSGEDGHRHSHSHSHPDASAIKEKESGLTNDDLSDEDRKHDHSHGHSHSHSPGADSHTGPLRNLPEIRKMLQEAPDQFLPPWVRETAIAAFTELAQAEAMTHGASSIDAVHFHEVGAVDSIVDTVGTLIALYNLGVTSVSCSRLPMGEGTVWTDHGLLPVPAPATLRLLVGMPLCQVS